MAVITHPDWPDPPVDRDAFYQDLKEFHRERGTTLDAVPKVSVVPIPLYDFFHIVQEGGGYDEVSAKKLEWRRLAEREYNLGGNQNAAAYAFQLKSLFYRNLAAYAIARVYKQEPPPKDILEEITAKGGGLLKRTRETFKADQALKVKPAPQESDSGSERDRDDGGGRTSRLRQAPPQRQFFQPDLSSTRQPRQVIPQAPPSPQPIIAPQAFHAPPPPNMDIYSPSFNIKAWPGRDQNAGLHVRPVPTPANSPAAHAEKIRRMRQRVLEAQAAQQGRTATGAVLDPRPSLLPGSGYPGPNVFKRSLLALKSGMPGEVDYGLHHFVRISSDRGETFFFEHYPGLVDALFEEGLKIASFFFDIKWERVWPMFATTQGALHELDGYRGTPDLLERIAQLRRLTPNLEFPDEQLSAALERTNSIGLILRNMLMQEQNCVDLLYYHCLGDLLTIWMTLPRHECLTELHSYLPEIIEEFTSWWTMDTFPRPLYLTVIERLEELLDKTDRGAIILLSALSKIGISTERLSGKIHVQRQIDVNGEQVKMDADELRLYGIKPKLLERILDLIMLEDDQIIVTCIDFLYRYFSWAPNVATFLQACANYQIAHEHYFVRFIQLMRREQVHNQEITMYKPAITALPPTEISETPPDLKEELDGIAEPRRAHLWLRCLFDEEPESDIKQIALWQAYQACWSRSSTQLLQASDFIKNVSEAFENATAQVIQGATPRFIIKGIRIRWVPVDLSGTPYLKCKWAVREPVSMENDGTAPHGDHSNGQLASGVANGELAAPKYRGTIERPCGSFQRTPQQLFEHILTHHLGFHRKADGQWDGAALTEEFKSQHLFCKWGRCRRFENDIPGPDPRRMAQHVKIHMPDVGEIAAHRAKYTQVPRPDPDEEIENGTSWPEEITHMSYYDTPRYIIDGREQLPAIPMNVLLVWRMLVRNIPKAAVYMQEHPNGGPTRESYQWLQFMMTISWDKLWYIITHDRILGPHVLDLVNMLYHGMEDEDGNLLDVI